MAEYRFFLRGFLSQWHPSIFELDGVSFNCAEQYMMWRKAILFKDHAMSVRILSVSKPYEQKMMGSHVSGFVQSVWDHEKQSIVQTGNMAKFSQNAGLKKKLIATGDAILVEANPNDSIWGIGLSEDDPRANNPETWLGTNYLGHILMQVREALQV